MLSADFFTCGHFLVLIHAALLTRIAFIFLVTCEGRIVNIMPLRLETDVVQYLLASVPDIEMDTHRLLVSVNVFEVVKDVAHKL